MDMDMDTGSDDQTIPNNINGPYANTLAGLLGGFILLLAIRHWVPYASRHIKSNQRQKLSTVSIGWTRICSLYKGAETYIINKFSYTIVLPKRFHLPPFGALILVAALISTILPLLLVSVDLKMNSNRAGFLTISTVPFTLATTGKSSVVAMLTGISPVRLNYFHRLLGLAAIVLATVHMSCMISTWSEFPEFLQAQLATTKVQHGLVGYGFLCVVVLGSILPIRRYAYEVFLSTHILVFGFLGAIASHTPYAMRYFAAGFFCYAVNLVISWLVKMHLARVRLCALPERCTQTLIRVSSPVKHKPGQYLYICIPSVSRFQWHPFTITSIQQDTTLELHACVCGNFTRHLYEKADDIERFAMISGPFGPGDDELQPQTLLQNNTIALMSAGAGVTFGMRLLREICASVTTVSFNTKDIYFYWSVRQRDELEWFRQELEDMMSSFSRNEKEIEDFPQLHVVLYVTRAAEAYEISEKSSYATSTPSKHEAKSHIHETTRIRLLLNQHIDAKEFLNTHAGSELGLYVCGPTSFNASFKNAVAAQPLELCSKIHLHTEGFEY